MDHCDICVVGAGVAGLAIARQLASSRKRQILLLEQHTQPGQETSSRNSEVIHAGLYYPPESLKARLCVRGRDLLYAWCREQEVPFLQTGKLIVASHDQEAALQVLAEKAAANGQHLQPLDRNQLYRLEPAVSADLALLSPLTGIIDSHAFMQSLQQQAERLGVDFIVQTKVVAVEPDISGFIVLTECQGEPYRFHTRQLINAAGLHAQTLAGSIAGLDQTTVPPLHLCKGSYFSYQGQSPFQKLIYPVPSAHGLGIHATLDMGRQLRFGPDTEYVQDIDYRVDETRSGQFAEAIMSYFPGLESARLKPDYAGLRPKLQAPDQPFADFMIQDGSELGLPGLVQLFGIESPGLTAALAIAEEVDAILQRQD